MIKQQGSQFIVEIMVFDTNPNVPIMSMKYTAPVRGGRGRVEAGPYDGVLFRRIGANTVELTYLNHGEKAKSGRATLSKDGQTMISKGRDGGKNAPPEWIMVMERQPEDR